MAYRIVDCESGRDPLTYDKRARRKTEKDREPEADEVRKTDVRNRQRNFAIKGRK